MPRNKDLSVQENKVVPRDIYCNQINSTTKKKCNLLAMVGQKKCAAHGGKIGYAQFMDSVAMQTTYQGYIEIPDKMDLSNELALMRTMLASVVAKIKKVKNIDEIKPVAIASIDAMTASIANLVRTMGSVEKSIKNTIHVEDLKIVCDGVISVLDDLGLPMETLEKVAASFESLAIPVWKPAENLNVTNGKQAIETSADST